MLKSVTSEILRTLISLFKTAIFKRSRTTALLAECVTVHLFLEFLDCVKAAIKVFLEAFMVCSKHISTGALEKETRKIIDKFYFKIFLLISFCK